MKREADQCARAREKRNREYLRKQHRKKERQTEKTVEQQDAQHAENWLERVLDIFVPTKPLTIHDQLRARELYLKKQHRNNTKERKDC